MGRIYAVAFGEEHARIIGWAESADEAVEIYREWQGQHGGKPSFTRAALNQEVSFDPHPSVNRIEDLERAGRSAWILSP